MAVAAGAKISAVARVYGMPRSTVSNVVRRNLPHLPVIVPKAVPKTPKLRAADLLKLEEVILKHRFLPSAKIAAHFFLKTYINLSPRTLRWYINKLGYNSYSAAQKPYLRPQNIVKRLAWAELYEKNTEDDWRRVIYSDESSFAVRPMKNNIRVWRKRGERYNFACTIPTFKSGYKLVNVYGAFSATGRTPLVRIEGKFNQYAYKKILDEVTLPFAFRCYDNVENFMLQEDNCAAHRAKSIEAYLHEKKVNRMEWPPQSPDLNPIENVWGYMKQKLRRRPVYAKNQDDLFNLLSKMWDEIPQTYFARLALGMHKRVAAVKRNEGKSTKY